MGVFRGCRQPQKRGLGRPRKTGDWERGGGRRWSGALPAWLTVGGRASHDSGCAVRPPRQRSANSSCPWRSVLGARCCSRQRPRTRPGPGSFSTPRPLTSPAFLCLRPGRGEQERSNGRRGHVTVRDVRAAAEPAKLKLVDRIVNKGTRDAQLRAAPCASIPRGPREPGTALGPHPGLEPGEGVEGACGSASVGVSEACEKVGNEALGKEPALAAAWDIDKHSKILVPQRSAAEEVEEEARIWPVHTEFLWQGKSVMAPNRLRYLLDSFPQNRLQRRTGCPLSLGSGGPR
ncbi:hypothetical protein R6Z07F_000398 [Ovis aries]